MNKYSRYFLFLLLAHCLFLSSAFGEEYSQTKSRVSYWATGGENSQEVKEELPFIERNALFRKLRDEHSVLFLDTREQNEYETSHLPGALHIPYHQVKDSFGEIQKEAAGKTIVPYCNWDFRAFVAGVQLKELGYKDVAMMYPHGLKGWQASSLPLAGKTPNRSDEAATQELTSILQKGSVTIPSETSGQTTVRPGETKHIAMKILKKKVEPRHITASRGDKLILDITAEEEDHWFVMPDFGIDLRLKQGETKTITITLTKSGYFPYGCITCCMHYQCQVRQAILVDLKEDPSYYGE